MTRLILFDIDGTLIHTHGAGMRAFERVFVSEFGAEPGITKKIDFAGRTDSSIWREFCDLQKVAHSPEDRERFFSMYVHWLDHLLEEGEGGSLPGVRRLLYELQTMPDPPLLGLLTGNTRLAAEIKLRHHEMWEPFETGAFGDEHHDRNELSLLAKHRGTRILETPLSGPEILVIGDTPRDIECARKAGARVLAVATGRSSVEELAEHQPDLVLPNLEDIPARDLCV